MKLDRLWHHDWFIAFLLFILVALLHLPAIQQPLDNDSGANAYGARLILQGEPLYSAFHPAHHLPGVYYTYALAFGLLGDRQQAVKFFLIPWLWLNAWVLLRAGQRLSGKTGGILAALIFVLLTSMTNLAGDTAEIELFANLPLTLVFWLGARTLEKKSSLAAYLLIGAVSGICFLYKAVYLTSLAAVGAVMLLDALLQRRRAAWPYLVTRAAVMLAGFAVIPGLAAAYFAALGLWSRFLLVFQIGGGYVGRNNDLSALAIVLLPLFLVGKANLTLVCLGLLASARLLWTLPAALKTNRPPALAHAMLLLWLAGSIFAAGFSRFAFQHYGLLLAPPLALLAGSEIAGLWARARQLQTPAKLAWLPLLLALAVIGNSFYSSRDYLGGYLRACLGQIPYEQFVRQDTDMGAQKMEAFEIAQYIEQHSAPQDLIFTWTDQAQISYLANRRSSSDVLWPAYAGLFGPPQRVFAAHPLYVVLGPNLFAEQEPPAWLTSELNRAYLLEKTFGKHRVYRHQNLSPRPLP